MKRRSIAKILKDMPTTWNCKRRHRPRGMSTRQVKDLVGRRTSKLLEELKGDHNG